MKKYGSPDSFSNSDNLNLINPLLNMFLNNSMQNNNSNKTNSVENKSGIDTIADKEQVKKAQPQRVSKNPFPAAPFNDIKYCKLIENHDKISKRIDRKNNKNNFPQEKNEND
ncbi:MAG: hypothetical protein FWG51_02570 [Firmicutes bacterium]|nr:hypothetical protein [Bacillota bacterium]